MKTPLGPLQGEYKCNLLFDLIHCEGAEAIAEYGDDFYAGMPVLTVNKYGKGQAWYVATSPDEAFLDGFLPELCREQGIEPLLADAPESVEVAAREKDGKTYWFLMNHAN